IGGHHTDEYRGGRTDGRGPNVDRGADAFGAGARSVAGVDMSASAADLPENRAVLMALWDAQPQELAVSELLRRTYLSVEQLQRSLRQLMQRSEGTGSGLIEQTPAGIRLVTVGLSWWRGVLETLAARHAWHLGRNVLVVPKTASTNDVAWER